MAKTFTLNEDWDIYVDKTGNLATSTDAYAIAQNVANAIRLFTKDAYFNGARGIPHYDIELGNPAFPAQSTLHNRIRQAVLGVEGVADTRIELEYDRAARVYTGEVQITTDDGTELQISV